MAEVTSARATVGWSLLAGALAVCASLHWNAVRDLRPVMPEVDGVHPVRAAQAVRSAYAPGGGFPDKYPPLGSFVMGVLVSVLDPDFAADTAAVTSLPDAARRELLWPLRDRVQALLEAERWVSRLTLGGCVALLAALVLALVERRDAGARGATRSPLHVGAALFAALGFGASAPALTYANTTNVDALALCFSLASLLLCVQRRWVGAAIALALATAVKDPAGALLPVLLVGAWFDTESPGGGVSVRAERDGATSGGRGARWRRTCRVLVAGALVYALASGAATGTAVWWQHVRYLFAGGISGVDRIDHGVPSQWAALLLYCARLVRGAIGLPAALLGLLGLLLLARDAGARGWLALGALLATPLLFVIPIGFVYARFLLMPLALLCAGVGVLLARLAGTPVAHAGIAARAGRSAAGRRLAAVALAAACVFGDAQAREHHQLVAGSDDARRTMADALPQFVPDGARLVLFADEREHGPPLDPTRFSLEVAGLDTAESRLRAWAAAPAAERPEFLLWMTFPNDRPSGLATPREELPAVGTRVGGVFEVVSVCDAAAAGSWPVRSFAVRPRVLLLRRL